MRLNLHLNASILKSKYLFHVQALLLARCLRGDLDGYLPFVWR
jgi:hypothetical protein